MRLLFFFAKTEKLQKLFTEQILQNLHCLYYYTVGLNQARKNERTALLRRRFFREWTFLLKNDIIGEDNTKRHALSRKVVRSVVE